MKSVERNIYVRSAGQIVHARLITAHDMKTAEQLECANHRCQIKPNDSVVRIWLQGVTGLTTGTEAIEPSSTRGNNLYNQLRALLEQARCADCLIAFQREQDDLALTFEMQPRVA